MVWDDTQESFEKPSAWSRRESSHPVPLVDLHATDQIHLDSKTPLQVGGATGEVAGEAASHEVALPAGAALVPNSSVLYWYLDAAPSCQPRTSALPW